MSVSELRHFLFRNRYSKIGRVLLWASTKVIYFAELLRPK